MRELNRYIKIVVSVCFYLLLFNFGAINISLSQDTLSQETLRGDLRLMFYNCENLFDTFDDSLKRDEEFLPDGDRNWSKYRYRKKLNNIYKVIIAVGGWNPPEIVGLCESPSLHQKDGAIMQISRALPEHFDGSAFVKTACQCFSKTIK